ncbi:MULTISPECIES: SGNH/GDSL hydrolase family protein [Sphingomonas]|uniref:SGNH/GDSL hydrolase family protein n=1 Tax=Sphingomonas TaxID=13687 RepID=UPI0008311E09|nr:SGNH/GDSL hydrolase family protein [Sphingomonas sp. CCH10-B3]
MTKNSIGIWISVVMAVVAVAAIIAAQFLAASPPTVATTADPSVAGATAMTVAGPPASLVRAAPDPEDDKITREQATSAIVGQEESFAKNAIVLLGDSIVARSGVYQLCGQPVLRAGIPGSRVRDWDDLGPDVFAHVRPRLVVFALGINDSVAAFKTDPAKWEADYRALVDAAQPAKVAFVSIMPFDSKAAAGAQIDGAMRDALNQRLAKVAKDTGGILIDPLPSADGLTLDGVHFNEIGQGKWAERLTAACKAI